MNEIVGRARIGQWYVRWDNGEVFRVTGRDERTHAVAIERFGGDVDAIGAATWRGLPLGFVDRPEDWARVVADVRIEYFAGAGG